MISVAFLPLRPRRLRAAARVGMVRVARHAQPARRRAAADRRRRPLAPVEAQQRAQERPRGDRPRRERPRDPPDRPRLAEQQLVAAVPGRAQRRGPGQHHRAVPHGGERVDPPVAARELRPQPRRLVGLVGERPALDPRQHAAALVLVAVGARVAPAQRPQEAAVLRRVGLADALVALAARGPRRHRQRGGEQQGEPPRRQAADEPVERVPAPRRYAAGSVASNPRGRLPGRDVAPEHDRAHAVGAEHLDVVERALPRRRRPTGGAAGRPGSARPASFPPPRPPGGRARRAGRGPGCAMHPERYGRDQATAS